MGNPMIAPTGIHTQDLWLVSKCANHYTPPLDHCVINSTLHPTQFSELYWPIYYSFSLQAPLAFQLLRSTTTLH